jgi:ferrous iron transport protein A
MRYFRRFRGPHSRGPGATGRVTNYRDENTLTLSDARAGKYYKLAAFQAGRMLKEKIYSMGLNSGVRFKVLLNPGHGPVELEVRQTRLGIGRGMAQRIRVREVE